ncbi:MAG: metallophosphoesterase [Azoarcus sp.]|jgi:predicted MPP superfamily phosphohydrolase|nr:metallophosphoesterase [Azoarcus sp.]
MFVVFIWGYVFLNIGLIVRLYFALRGPGVSRPLRLGLCLLAVVFSLAFPAARWFEGNGFWMKALTFTGTFCLSMVLHAVLVWILVDAFRLLNRYFHWFSIAPERRVQWRHRCCAGIAGAALLLSGGGWINTQYPVIREVKLPAPAGTAPFRIVLVSDTHLGRLASPAFFNRLVDSIESASPDLVLFAGDILEYDFDSSDVAATAAALQRLKPRLGIWAVLGNHEHINGRGGLNKRLLMQIGFRVLVDEWAETGEAHGEKLLLIGRDDLSSRYFTGHERKTLDKILADAPKDGRLKILLDHQPYHLAEAEAAGVYLQVSGHTHNGQLFPVNWVVATIYENAHGHSMRGSTNYWVTSGAGTWGPRVRTSGRAEIVAIDLVPQ